MLRARDEELRTGVGYTTELAGRDRAKFFRRPVQAHNVLPGAGIVPDETNLQFAASCPSLTIPVEQSMRAAMHDLKLTSRRTRHSRPPHHLPSLQSHTASHESASSQTRDVAQQTDYRENDTQTDPYSPDYVIPDGAPEPEIWQLRHLHWNAGLPAGAEEVALLSRLRRRREVEANLPTGTDPDAIAQRYLALHALEEQEWADREAHVAQLQERRMAKLRDSLLERERAHESVNQARLDRIRAQSMTRLRQKLERLETRRLTHTRRGLDTRMALAATDDNQNSNHTAPTVVPTVHTRALLPPSMRGSTRPDWIRAYVHYGTDAAPPALSGPHWADVGYGDARAALRAVTQNYDVRPTLLTRRAGAEAVEAGAARGRGRVGADAFTVPVAEAIRRLPTLYQRHEAERVVRSLDYAQRALDAAKSTTMHPTPSRPHVLELYRASPRPQRPDTPELEVEGEEVEGEEEGCVLLQRLLRGRAVQNDYFEGKERCRGLIAELQAASNAKYAERSLVNVKEREEMVGRQEAMVHTVLDAAQGDVVQQTLGFLFEELTRQQSVYRVGVLRDAAEETRRTREAAEIARREADRLQRDREEVQYAALTRATQVTIEGYLQELCGGVITETALACAVAGERARQAGLAPPRSPRSPRAREGVVCEVLDEFVLPSVVDLIDRRAIELDKMAPARVALDVMRDASPVQQSQSDL